MSGGNVRSMGQTMYLTPEQFAELASIGTTSDTKAHRPERRRTARVGMQARVTIVLIRNGQPTRPITLVARDVSSRGINLLLPSPLPVGQQFITELSSTQGQRLRLMTRVAYCRALPGGQSYTIGAGFECTMSDSTSTADPCSDAQKRIEASMFD